MVVDEPIVVERGRRASQVALPTYEEIKAKLWPDVYFYPQQWEMIRSVEESVETYVTAGNQLGKDFVTGFVCVATMIKHPVARVVTTSVKGEHLDVLWGEINKFINNAKYPLRVEEGGLLEVNHMLVRKRDAKGVRCPTSYLRGMVAGGDKTALAGHHAPFTLAVVDEASGVEDAAYEKMQGWAKRMLVFGNPHQCNNFFKRGVKAGDLVA